MKSNRDKTKQVEQLPTGKKPPVNPIEEVKTTLRREIAVHLLRNRACVNNIAVLHQLQRLDARDQDSGTFKLEFDIAVRDRPVETFRKFKMMEDDSDSEGTGGGGLDLTFGEPEVIIPVHVPKGGAKVRIYHGDSEFEIDVRPSKGKGTESDEREEEE